MALVTAKQFTEDIFGMLKECVAEEYKDATEEEREQAVGRILDAWSVEMFKGPVEDASKSK